MFMENNKDKTEEILKLTSEILYKSLIDYKEAEESGEGAKSLFFKVQAQEKLLQNVLTWCKIKTEESQKLINPLEDISSLIQQTDEYI